jgi:hypothetical protein
MRSILQRHSYGIDAKYATFNAIYTAYKQAKYATHNAMYTAYIHAKYATYIYIGASNLKLSI